MQGNDTNKTDACMVTIATTWRGVWHVMMLAPNVFCLKCFAWIPMGDGRHNRIFSCDFDMFRETYFF